MRKLLLSIFLVALSANVHAEVISDEKIQQLEQLHQKAEDSILVNKFDDALIVYDEILLLEPDDEIAYTNMGHVYMLMGDTARAKNAFLNALHINPDNERAQFGLMRIEDPDSPLPDEENPEL